MRAFFVVSIDTMREQNKRIYSAQSDPSFHFHKVEHGILSSHVTSPDIYLISDSMAYMENHRCVLRVQPEMGIAPKDTFGRIYNLLHDQYDAECIFSDNSLLGK
jgi:hypothetical protein